MTHLKVAATRWEQGKQLASQAKEGLFMSFVRLFRIHLSRHPRNLKLPQRAQPLQAPITFARAEQD